MSKSHILVVFALGAALAGLFAPALTGGASFVFRDAAHFYHPLFQFTRSEWGARRVPLWNPYENLGQPLVGDATSSVFYPGKLVFALPLDYTLLYNGYIVAHVALAALTSFWLARRWGASVPAAGLAAVSYALSGNVLFQYANVVFLVGAAWLPLALVLADRMLAERSWGAAVGLGAVMAMMVTGGDPQMAYHVGLLAGLYGVIRTIERSATLTPALSHQGRGRRAGTPALFALAAVTCFALAAIQILPAWAAARHSARSAYDAPRSLYELAASVTGNSGETDRERWYEGLLGISSAGHERAIYDFSVGPWRVIELVWPNVCGQQFPTYHRWLNALPAEGRVWTPSLYMGLLPLALAVCSFSMRRSAPPEVQWLSWMVLLSGLASFGVYGLAWTVRELAGWFGVTLGGAVGDEVGGLYWLMTVVLPGYVYFRYPAKLLVIASLGIAMLAARGFDAALETPSRRLPRLLLGVCAASLAALGLARLFWPALCARLETIRPDPLFGPFDCDAAHIGLVAGCWQTALLAALFWFLLGAGRHWRWAPAACLTITVIDLAMAQAPLMAYAPADAWRRLPSRLSAMAALTAGNSPSPLLGYEYRCYRDGACWPESWRHWSSSVRLRESLDWDRNTLRPRHHLPLAIPLVESSGTLVPHDVQVFWEVARRHAEPPAALPHPSILDLTGVLIAVVPERLAPNGVPLADDVTMVRRPKPLPRAWIVHDVEMLPQLHARTPSLVERRTEDVLFPGGRPRDWATSAVVESDESLPVAPEDASAAAEEACQINSADPQRVEILARLTRPGLVVLADAYDPGWRLTVETDGVTRDVPILRTNRVMRGAPLPAGRHRLVYEYRPASVLWGAAISGASGVAVAVLGLVIGTRRWRVVCGARTATGHAGRAARTRGVLGADGRC